MNNAKTHPFHLVDPSCWPILTSLSLIFVPIGGVMMMHEYIYGPYVCALGVSLLLFCLYSWWKDVIHEALVDKNHNYTVRRGIKIGMVLFIASEVMFFFVFFWSFFKARLFPMGALDGLWVVSDGRWPPSGIEFVDPWHIPLFNTLVLSLSSTTVNWASYALAHNKQKQTSRALAITILLGILFVGMQAYEYHHASFNIDDGIYAANFYLVTGFHGFHVIIGVLFLSICYFRSLKGHFRNGNSYLGFELAAWYWNFVDIVWILLFILIYILGS
ncbi:MAG: cytochrome c oxidase subunit 3 [Rickettsiaceae bacterium]